MKTTIKYKVALLLIPAIIIVKTLSYFPNIVEKYYSNGIYPFISKLSRALLGWIPFSFGDLVYAFIIIHSIRWLVLNRKRTINDFKSWSIDVFATISVIYIAFHLFWGLNYYRQPLHKNLNLKATYTTEELVEVTKKLIHKSNTIHSKISTNDTLKIQYKYTKADILKRVPEGYNSLKTQFPHLNYAFKSIKTSLFSLPLTYMGFSGYLNPLTNEAQIDYLIPAYKFPTTASHEVAHQLGYAAENEANFIGCLAAAHHNDIYFNYSGYTFALRHCLIEIHKRNPETFTALKETIHPGILKNYKEVQDFWNDYKNPAEPLFKKSYHAYLEANSQKGGMKSYSYVVALLVNYFKDQTI